MMADEGIAIKLADLLEKEPELSRVKFIIGETDTDYCLDFIEDKDFLFILDATYLGITPGTVTITPIEKSNQLLASPFTQHDLNILTLLSLYNKNISGYIIGVEVASINFDNNISPTLKSMLPEICSNIKSTITSIISDKNIALQA